MLKLSFNSLILIYPLSLLFLIFIILSTFNYQVRFLFHTKNIFILSLTFISLSCASIIWIPYYETLYFTFYNINIIILTLIFVSTCFICYFMFNLIFIMEELIILISVLFISISAISANNLISLFVCFESLNICFFILILSSANDAKSIEASLQYIFVSIITSLCFLTGTFFIYLTCMSFTFKDINLYLTYAQFSSIELELYLGFFLIATSFFIKLGIFPFYNWLIQVYSSFTLKPLIIISTLLKFVFSLMFLSILTQVNLIFTTKLSLLFLIGGFGSLWISCFHLFVELKTKKMLALISLMSNGFLLLFWYSTTTELTYILSLSYITIQAFNLLFTFGFLAVLQSETNDLPVSILNLRNYGEINFNFLIFFICSIFSLIGIPPFSGFFPKTAMIYYLYINNYTIILSFFLIFTIFSCFCFLRLIISISKTEYNTGMWKTINKSKIYYLIFFYLVFNIQVIFIHYQIYTFF